MKVLLAAMREKKGGERLQAIDDLGKLGEIARPSAGALCEVVANETSAAARKAALSALEKIHPEVARLVVVLVVEADSQKHVKAVREIGELGEDGRLVLPVLMVHLRSAPTRFPASIDAVMSEDVHALGLIAPTDPAVHKAIIDLTRFSRGPLVRSAAIQSIGEVVRKNPEQAKSVTPLLITATKSMTDAEVRRQAVGVLATIAEGNVELRPQIVGLFIALIKAGELSPVLHIVKCGRDAKEAIPVLKQLKVHPQEDVRTAANEAISQIEDAVARATAPPRKDDPPTVKKEDSPVKPDVPRGEDTTLPAELRPVVARLKSGTTEERVKAAEQLGGMGERAKPAARPLCEASLDPSQKISRASLQALEKVNPDLQKEVFVLVVDEKAANHQAALRQLGTLGEDARAALPVVLQEIKRCQEAIGNNPARWDNARLITVITESMEALPKIAPEDPQIVKTLIDLTKFTSPTQFVIAKPNRPLKGVITRTPFRDEGLRLLGDLADGQPAHRKQIIPPLITVLKEAVERTNSKTDAEVLEGITEVDEAGNALVKCGKEAQQALAKEVLPRLKDLQFHKSEQVRRTAEQLQQKIENAK